MKMKKTLCIILSALLLLVLLCGCGGSSYPKSESYSPAAAADSAAKSDGKVDYNGSMGWAAESYDMPAAVPQEAMSNSTSAMQSSGGLPANVKLIYRATIEMESTEFDEALQGLNALVSRMGGYFEMSELNNYSNYRHGSYTVRLPAENFDAFCAAVGELCQVNNLSRSAEDISERYYDTESRLATQQTKLARLQELLRQAEDTEDIITLESAISETELAIEQLTGTLRKYDSLVGYATVNLYLSEVYKLSEVEQPAIGFGAKLASAFRSGASRFVNGCQDLLLGIARGWIGWLIFIIIVVAALLIIRKVRRSRAARYAKTRPAVPPVQPPQNPQPQAQQPPQNPQPPQGPQE